MIITLIGLHTYSMSNSDVRNLIFCTGTTRGYTKSPSPYVILVSKRTGDKYALALSSRQSERLMYRSVALATGLGYPDRER